MNAYASEIKNAIDELRVAMEDYATAEVDRIRAKDVWDRGFCIGMAQERFPGKNAEERMGKALLALGNEWETLQACIEWSEKKKLSLDLAWLELNKWKLLLRVDELEAKTLAEVAE